MHTPAVVVVEAVVEGSKGKASTWTVIKCTQCLEGD